MEQANKQQNKNTTYGERKHLHNIDDVRSHSYRYSTQQPAHDSQS